MTHINVITFQHGLICNNHLFTGNNENEVVKQAESKFKEYILQLKNDGDINTALENGYFNYNGNEVIITWPQVTEVKSTEKDFNDAYIQSIIPITNLDTLKNYASRDGGFDFYMTLMGGTKSCKHISYDKDEGIFYVLNEIDSSEEKLTEEQIMDDAYTNIGKGIRKKFLYILSNDAVI